MVLHLLLCFVFALCERKNRVPPGRTDIMASTMLSQAKNGDLGSELRRLTDTRSKSQQLFEITLARPTGHVRKGFFTWR